MKYVIMVLLALSLMACGTEPDGKYRATIEVTYQDGTIGTIVSEATYSHTPNCYLDEGDLKFGWKIVLASGVRAINKVKVERLYPEASL